MAKGEKTRQITMGVKEAPYYIIQPVHMNQFNNNIVNSMISLVNMMLPC